MSYELPPTGKIDRLLTELSFVSPRDRDDAVQEAWQAHLEGRDPARAVATFAQRLRRGRRRLVVNSEVLAVL